MHFSIDQWRAWAPGLEQESDWQAWSLQSSLPAASESLPDVNFLPAMQRRRLSPLARMAFSVAWPLADAHGTPLPLVFVSRHGETPRAFTLLSDVCAQAPLSPTQFSLSVHNAIIGQWSIMRGDTSEMTALAGEGDGLEHAVLEAQLLLAEGAPAVLLVIAEDTPPAAYAPWITDVPFPYAVALLLKPGQDWQLKLQACPPPENASSADTATAEWPHALNLVRALSGGVTTLEHRWRSRQWSWQQNSA
ncbi:beta-ketoacyl synthase chain length factor [Pseudomonas turukhanskensis]|uniref:3-oxoacyl-ACP synthase n=1 Tax=Pseudomonas turukhanskensis TaxID=1806536 RepID=A0A9W6KCC3_9PSED|nr:beta-ketoacyl synthase chain length factor [Pseudomonas turukhanskensis]GLK92069.1 3-oxoacyl-ACP synthase [Pseudomonas turukhanskensis]